MNEVGNMVMCSRKGCKKEARWEIEMMEIPPCGVVYSYCDEHCPNPELLDPIQDSIKRIE